MRRPAVIFDLDDTIYPSNQFVEGGIIAASAVLKRMTGVSVDPVGVLTEILRTEGPFYIFDRGFSVLGIERTPELMSALVTAFRYHEPVLTPYPGMVELISDLRDRGVAIGLVTDGHADVQRRKWDVLGLNDMFDAVVFCRDVDGLDRPKPDPLPFVVAASRLGSPNPCVFVGDNPSADFPAPDAFGWKTVRVCWPESSHVNDGDVDSARTIVRSVESLRTALFGLTAVG